MGVPQICHDIVLPVDMLDISGKLRDEGEVARLARGPLCGTAHGAGEGLVVHEDGKGPPLKVVSKILCREVHGK